MPDPNKSDQPLKASLGLFDAVSIIIGIVIGSGIYKTAPFIMFNLPSPAMTIFFWVFAGVLVLIGALCYAELATTYPRSGGDYVYLTRAFGPFPGFLFGWAQLAVILTASIGSMAFVFADYTMALFEGESTAGKVSAGNQVLMVLLAVGAIAVLSVVNVMGVVLGKTAQNILTILKIVGLSAIVVSGLVWGKYHETGLGWTDQHDVFKFGGFGLALVLILYTYGGWNDAAFVASEVKNRRRNIPRALILGTAMIVVIYVLVNLAYIFGLGFGAARSTNTVAADVLHLSPLGDYGYRAMCILVMISALGAVNGLIFTGSRVYSSLGKEHSVFAFLGKWYRGLGSPLWALIVQAIIASAMVFAVGTTWGRDAIDEGFAKISPYIPEWMELTVIPWDTKFQGGFETLVSVTAPVFWMFFLLTGLSLFALRDRDANLERPFTVPLYPLVPFLFCLTCVYMLWKSIAYAEWLSLVGIIPLAIGVPLYFISKKNISMATKPEDVHAADEAIM
jgi:amino acid transporter